MSKEAKILVVDDDKQLADMLVEWLDKKGYHALAEYGGQDGIKAFEQGDYDLVITGLVMPDMDGMGLLEAVKAMDRRV
jgi:DNA-binding response OmpR family regulator